MTAERERTPVAEPGPSSHRDAAERSDTHQSTAAPVTVDRSEVLMLDAELRAILDGAAARPIPSTQAALTDTERLSMALVDTFGPTWARRLASELEQAADEIAPRRPFPGGGQ